MSSTFLFPVFFSRHDTVATFLHRSMHRFPRLHASCLSYHLPSLVISASSFVVPASPSRHLSISDSPRYSRYPYILSLFPGSLCGHVQYTYTSTLIPARPFSSFHSCNPSGVPLPPSLLNIFSLQFTSRVCVLWLWVFCEPLRVPFVAYIPLLFNFHVHVIAFSCPTALTPYSKSQLFSFPSPVIIFEGFRGSSPGLGIFSHTKTLFIHLPLPYPPCVSGKSTDA